MAEQTLSFELDVAGLEELAEDMRRVERATPEIAQKWLYKAGQAFLKDVRTQTRAVTKTKTKHLVNGYRQRVVLKHGSLTSYESLINGGNRKAAHFHLVEEGHRGFVPVNRFKKGCGVRPIGFVQGKHMMQTTRNNWSSHMKSIPFAAKAIEEALKEGELA